jgi:hypothetical protein
LALFLYILLAAAKLQATEPTNSDTLQQADSVAGADSLPSAPSLAANLFLRSSTGLAALLADSLGRKELSGGQLERSFPLYLDDVFRLDPSMVGGDSLGNGYARRFSPLGSGFEAVRVLLNGMPLDDPLTGSVDWRLVAPEIVGSAFALSGGAFSAIHGGSDEIHLFTKQARVQSASSEMGIAGGAYNINKVAGGLRRSLFGAGALHVRINKIQQSTEDLANKVEQIQYFTRLERSINSRMLLSLDGLFFSNEFRPRFMQGKLRQTNTHFQAALAGKLTEQAGYSLAYRYSGSRHPFLTGSDIMNLGARSHEIAGNLLYQPHERVALGVDFGNLVVRPRDFPADTLSYSSHLSRKMLGMIRLAAPLDLHISCAAGLRSFRNSANRAIIGLGISKILGERGYLLLNWKREAMLPSLATRIRSFDLNGWAGEYPLGRLETVEAGLGFKLPGGRHLHAGLFTRNAENLTLAAYEPRPLQPAPARFADFRTTGVSYRLEGPLFAGLVFQAAGIELFDPPWEVPYLTLRRHAASLALETLLYGEDMGLSLQAEMVYEGEMYFPASDNPAAALIPQPGRVNFGGAAAVRIVDFTIYCRLDFLMSGYYINLDPLKLPGPRAVVGVNWQFLD